MQQLKEKLEVVVKDLEGVLPGTDQFGYREAMRSVITDIDTQMLWIEKNDLGVTESLLEQRQRVLDEVPECPIHGGNCVPHAVEWIKAKKENEADDEDTKFLREIGKEWLEKKYTPDLKKILETILKGQFEIIKILRQSVVSVAHIKEVFAHYNIREDEFKF